MKTDIYKIKTDQAWNRLYNRLDNDRLLAKVDEGRSIRKHSQWIRYGAVAAVLIGVVWGALYWMTGSEREPAQNFLTQENQGISTLATTLEDGSVVLLAKETSLLYPKHFIADKREVSLQGNAFFDVAKKQGQPFWIDTEQAKIEVLGTAFSVQSDEHAPFRLSVQRGIVKVWNKGKYRPVILTDQLRKRLLYYIRKNKIQKGNVFITRSGHEKDRSNIWRELKQLAVSAGVETEKVFPHNFRHMFARIFYRVTGNLLQLADILGHSSIEVTRIYASDGIMEWKKSMEMLEMLVE